MPLPADFFDGTFGISAEIGVVTAAFYVTLYHEEKSAEYCNFKNMKSNIEFDMSEATVSLLHLCRKFSNRTKIKGLERNMYNIQNALKSAEIMLETKKSISCESQIVMFDEQTGNLINMIPPKFDDTLRPLFILGIKQKGQTAITGIITNIAQYFAQNKFGFFCFFCQKRFSGRGSTHKCRQRRSCFACHRYLLQCDTYVNSVMQSLFCADEMAPKIKEICETCNISLRNESCKTIHAKKNCRWGWFCLKCQKYTFRNKFVQTIQEIQQSHLCNIKTCKFCGRMYSLVNEKEHLCTLQTLQPPTNATKLAFLQMSFRGRSSTSCLECFKKNLCTFCSKEDPVEQPNIAVLLVENLTGTFDSYTFADLDLYNYTIKEKNVLTKEYLPEDVQLPQKAVGKTTYFNQIKKIQIDQKTFSGDRVIEQVLQFMLYKDFSNTTLVVNCKQTNELCFFVQTLIQYGFKPKILKSENRIILVECPEMCLRIVDAQNYVSSSHEDIAKEENITFHYFPKKWNKKSQYNYVGLCPQLSDFFSFEDTEEDVERKKKFIKNFGSSVWKFKTEIRLHTGQKVLLTAISILNMVQTCFELQKLLIKSYGKAENLFLHPINRPFLTYSGFIYQLFLRFCDADLRMVRKPIDYQSSRGEIEFAEYLCYQIQDQEKLIYAWSPHGQYKDFLPICVPDIFDLVTKTAYFFNGCVIHNHEQEKCLFKRKHSSFQQKTQFKTKLEKLAACQNIEKIKVIWQCEWQNQKKNNQDVKAFLENIYRNPPPFRLDVRWAGDIILF